MDALSSVTLVSLDLLDRTLFCKLSPIQKKKTQKRKTLGRCCLSTKLCFCGRFCPFLKLAAFVSSPEMNRAKKYCCYRDCNVNSQTHPELTLFQFPKSDLRAAKWCELGCVDPADIRLQFMCELHFSRIYMCFSSRRKMLLSTAIPYAYGEPIQDQEEVQSSSSMLENEDISIEEHLDESK